MAGSSHDHALLHLKEQEILTLRAQIEQLQLAQLAQPPSHSVVPPPEDEVTVVDMVNGLRSPIGEQREEALSLLSELVDLAYGEDGAAIGRVVREGGGVQVLGWMLLDTRVEVQQEALLVLGNLCSNEFDPQSLLTKRLLLECGAHRALLSCIQSEDMGLVVYTCGTIQNLCHEDMWAQLFVREGLVPRLAYLATSQPDERIQRYAAGALINIQAMYDRLDKKPEWDLITTAAVKERELAAALEALSRRRALRIISAHACQIPQETRIARELKSRERQSRRQLLFFAEAGGAVGEEDSSDERWPAEQEAVALEEDAEVSAVNAPVLPTPDLARAKRETAAPELAASTTEPVAGTTVEAQGTTAGFPTALGGTALCATSSTEYQADGIATEQSPSANSVNAQPWMAGIAPDVEAANCSEEEEEKIAERTLASQGTKEPLLTPAEVVLSTGTYSDEDKSTAALNVARISAHERPVELRADALEENGFANGLATSTVAYVIRQALAEAAQEVAGGMGARTPAASTLQSLGVVECHADVYLMNPSVAAIDEMASQDAFAASLVTEAIDDAFSEVAVEISSPEVAAPAPDAAAPDAAAPDVAAPDAAAPDAAAPDAAAPDEAAPDEAAPDEAAPDVAAPDAAAPDVGTPDVGALDATAPDVASPDVATPDVASPDVAAPDVAAPDVGALDATAPDVASPDVASPDVASPDVAAPNAAAPVLASPDVAATDVSATDVAATDVAATDVAATDASAEDVDAGVSLHGGGERTNSSAALQSQSVVGSVVACVMQKALEEVAQDVAGDVQIKTLESTRSQSPANNLRGELAALEGAMVSQDELAASIVTCSIALALSETAEEMAAKEVATGELAAEEVAAGVAQVASTPPHSQEDLFLQDHVKARVTASEEDQRMAEEIAAPLVADVIAHVLGETEKEAMAKNRLHEEDRTMALSTTQSPTVVRCPPDEDLVATTTLTFEEDKSLEEDKTLAEELATSAVTYAIDDALKEVEMATSSLEGKHVLTFIDELKLERLAQSDEELRALDILAKSTVTYIVVKALAEAADEIRDDMAQAEVESLTLAPTISMLPDVVKSLPQDRVVTRVEHEGLADSFATSMATTVLTQALAEAVAEARRNEGLVTLAPQATRMQSSVDPDGTTQIATELVAQVVKMATQMPTPMTATSISDSTPQSPTGTKLAAHVLLILENDGEVTVRVPEADEDASSSEVEENTAEHRAISDGMPEIESEQNSLRASEQNSLRAASASSETQSRGEVNATHDACANEPSVSRNLDDELKAVEVALEAVAQASAAAAEAARGEDMAMIRSLASLESSGSVDADQLNRAGEVLPDAQPSNDPMDQASDIREKETVLLETNFEPEAPKVARKRPPAPRKIDRRPRAERHLFHDPTKFQSPQRPAAVREAWSTDIHSDASPSSADTRARRAAEMARLQAERERLRKLHSSSLTDWSNFNEVTSPLGMNHSPRPRQHEPRPPRSPRPCPSFGAYQAALTGEAGAAYLLAQQEREHEYYPWKWARMDVSLAMDDTPSIALPSEPSGWSADGSGMLPLLPASPAPTRSVSEVTPCAHRTRARKSSPQTVGRQQRSSLSVNEGNRTARKFAAPRRNVARERLLPDLSPDARFNSNVSCNLDGSVRTAPTSVRHRHIKLRQEASLHQDSLYFVVGPNDW